MKRKSKTVSTSWKKLKTLKQELRRITNELCQQISPGERARAGKLLAINISQLPEFQKARKILLFSSLPSEIPTNYLVQKSRGKQIFLPRVKGKQLEVCQINHWPGDLSPGWKNIAEPRAYCQQFSPRDMDLVIIPARGYDIRGNRLGRGGGLYDRLLKAVNWKKRLGVAYSFQVLPKIPRTRYDQIVSKIVTEKEIITITEENL